jgi:hypothetical protein
VLAAVYRVCLADQKSSRPPSTPDIWSAWSAVSTQNDSTTVQPWNASRTYQGTLTQAAWQQISVRAPICSRQYSFHHNGLDNVHPARQVCSGDRDCVDVAAEWVVVETVELAAAWVVLTCAVTTAARPRLRMAKNFILASV